MDAATQPAQVPQLNLEPVASLDCWSLQFRFCGRDFELPAHPASVWLAVLMEPMGLLATMVELLDPDDVVDFTNLYLYMDGELDDLLCDLIEAASGRRWWVALRLVGSVRGSWSHLGAAMLLDGLDPTRMPFAAWLDVFTYKFVALSKPEQATMWAMQLEMAPEGEEEEPEALEMSRDQFLSLG